jgi:hypothetical protein
MICSNNVCVRQNGSGAGCRTVCNTFEQCQVGETDCFANCATSLENWRREAVEAYAACYDDVSEAECSSVRQFEDGPQNYCVSALPQVADRVQTCNNFDDKSRLCLSSGGFAVSEYQKQLQQLAGECRLSAKTLSFDAWNDILLDGCQVGLDDNECGPLFRCINGNFDIGRTDAETEPGEQPFPPFPTSLDDNDMSDDETSEGDN